MKLLVRILEFCPRTTGRPEHHIYTSHTPRKNIIFVMQNWMQSYAMRIEMVFFHWKKYSSDWVHSLPIRHLFMNANIIHHRKFRCHNRSLCSLWTSSHCQCCRGRFCQKNDSVYMHRSLSFRYNIIYDQIWIRHLFTYLICVTSCYLPFWRNSIILTYYVHW